ncbi:hypothetical protein HK098_007733 [Nowakowskiella sp. JEL0407]|nr:hypothetical protein HK098_007733 [Nowakowskiella sp. JEL0407]
MDDAGEDVPLSRQNSTSSHTLSLPHSPSASVYTNFAAQPPNVVAPSPSSSTRTANNKEIWRPFHPETVSTEDAVAIARVISSDSHPPNPPDYHAVFYVHEYHRSLFRRHAIRLWSHLFWPFVMPIVLIIFAYSQDSDSSFIYGLFALWIISVSYVAFIQRRRYSRLKKLYNDGLLPSIPEIDLLCYVMQEMELRRSPDYESDALRFDEALPEYDGMSGNIARGVQRDLDGRSSVVLNLGFVGVESSVENIELREILVQERSTAIT